MAGNIVPYRYKLIDSTSLDECPDTVEKCPGYNLFICGTYELLGQSDESTPAHLMNRKGSIYLFSVENNKLVQRAVTRTEAILDSKWRLAIGEEKYIFGTADARGMINFYELCSEARDDQAAYHTNVFSSVCAAKDGLALSLDWSVNGTLVACSDSNGCISLLTVTARGASLTSCWKAHEAEAWITSFNLWDENIIYSGADDCLFRGWDKRSKSAMFTNKSHEAGVCSIQCNPLSPFTIATGSYDERVRVWDSRCIRRSPLAEMDTKGGIWRIKWHRQKKDRMITACMYGGFEVIEFNEDGTLTKTASFNIADGSLAYGVDWLCGSDENNCQTIGSCTFYDRKLFIGLLQE